MPPNDRDAANEGTPMLTWVIAFPTPKVTFAGPKVCKLGEVPSSCHEMVC